MTVSSVCWVNSVWVYLVVMVKVTVGLGTMHGMSVRHVMSCNLGTLRPLNVTRMFWGRWRLSTVRVGGFAIIEFRRVDSSLVGATLVLDHGGLAAETKNGLAW